MAWNLVNQPGPKVVSSGSVSRPVQPRWSPTNQPGPKTVQGANPPVPADPPEE